MNWFINIGGFVVGQAVLGKFLGLVKGEIWQTTYNESPGFYYLMIWWGMLWFGFCWKFGI